MQGNVSFHSCMVCDVLGAPFFGSEERTVSHAPKPLVLLVEDDEAMLELNRQILEEAGYRIETPPRGADVLTFIEQIHPQLIVVDVGYNASSNLDLVSAIQSNPKTREIPVVAISTAQATAAQAKAAPVTSAAIVAPYDIEQLEKAVAHALHNPPPAAAVPATGNSSSEAVDFVTEEVTKNIQRIVIRAVRELRGVEPYKSRFNELTVGLVDSLEKPLGAISQGLRRSLPPAQVFSVPAVHRSIEEHVQLRKAQHLGAASVVQEYQLLAQYLREFIAGLVGKDNVTKQDAFRVDQQLLQYVDELIREVVRLYNADSGTTNKQNQ